jgi:hypothetical protein
VQNLEEFVDSVPEEIKPKNVIKFAKVFGISANEGPAAVVELKQVIKDMMGEINVDESSLDDYEENAAK